MEELLSVLRASEPTALMKTGIRTAHLLGLVLGLGAATLLDLIIIRFLVLGTIAREHAALVEFMSWIVAIGLAILWLSGIAFLMHYLMFDPAKLGNQKVWAKIGIVFVLTLNGLFIHKLILPTIRARIGQTLLAGISMEQRHIMLALGAISGTSWYVPFLLGAIPQVNAVSFWSILTIYAMILITAILATQRITAFFISSPSDETSEQAYQALLQRITLSVTRDANEYRIRQPR